MMRRLLAIILGVTNGFALAPALPVWTEVLGGTPLAKAAAFALLAALAVVTGWAYGAWIMRC